MNLARWLEEQQRLDEAAEIVAGIVADEPRQHWAHERLGELKARQRRFGEAAASFATCSGFVCSCGVFGSQPIRSARTLKSIRLPVNSFGSASGDRISLMDSFS